MYVLIIVSTRLILETYQEKSHTIGILSIQIDKYDSRLGPLHISTKGVQLESTALLVYTRFLVIFVGVLLPLPFLIVDAIVHPLSLP